MLIKKPGGGKGKKQPGQKCPWTSREKVENWDARNSQRSTTKLKRGEIGSIPTLPPVISQNKGGKPRGKKKRKKKMFSPENQPQKKGRRLHGYASMNRARHRVNISDEKKETRRGKIMKEGPTLIS